MPEKKVSCVKCKYFYVTWDQRFPRGCKAFGFKTKKWPSMEVHTASGQSCLRFEKKN
ncbi:uracil-DNA glycosylase [Cytobacillus kochii]|nr:uracil-DNA glycosylase [Cytobacillus kochii]MCA1026413.1 uracil-DNA glycosylase [Cytobacillus kochii]MCM3322440.1 uracil-DNA glycosylase [Cytobacillus kochii]MCM3345082.1 uracil-DNA glycosylase [Cytobacillus kochii]MDM5209637.1 uracil-DNA glycosylase [Cytobacillus kochii]